MSTRLLLLPVLLHLAAASPNSSVCVQPTVSAAGPTMMPSLPDTFEAHIEMKSLTKNSTEMIKEYYDKRSNQSALKTTRQGKEINLYINHSTQEVFTVSLASETCQVSNTSTSSQRFIFGSGGNLSSLLQSGMGGVQVYKGQDVVRGIQVQKWYSCQYWKKLDATMNVTWYMSDSSIWDSSSGVASGPIRGWVKGHTGSDAGDAAHEFEHIYDVYHFMDDITDPEAFQVPGVIYCPGRQAPKAFPDLPKSFSMTSEEATEVLGAGGSISYIFQWFDSEMKLSKSNYRTDQGTEWVSEIHDFNSGVAYITDMKLGSCKIQPIEPGDSDNIPVDHLHVRMMHAREFLLMDTKNVSYRGVGNTRHMPTDLFYAERTDYPSYMPVRTMWEWHFVQANTSLHVPAGTLVKMILHMPELQSSFIYNVFDMNSRQIEMSEWDISACYADLPRRIFRFAVPGNYTDTIQLNPNLFKKGVTTSVILLTVISPLRVVNIQLQYSSNVLVTFDMLGVPPIKGDVGNVTQTPLDVAADRLVKTFNQFFVYYPYNGTPYDIYAIPSSLVEVTVVLPTSTAKPTTVPPYWPDQSTVSAKTPIPSLPVSFEVHIKRVMSEVNMSTETHEVYDQQSGQLSLTKTHQGVVSLTIINITEREVHSIDPKQKTCTLSKLPTGDVDTVIGYTSDKGGKGEIFSVAGALVYGAHRSFRYRGRAVTRGVDCLQWSLLNVTLGGDINNNMDIMWYFSDPNSWDTALNWPWAPVRAVVTGRDDRLTPSIYYENMYDFIHFKNFIQAKNAFRTPDWVTCSGRNPVKSFPTLATAASFTTEALDQWNGVITNIHEWFDTDMKLTKYVYRPTPAMNSSYGSTSLTEIHDFNTGVAYVIDNIRGNCTVKPIETTSFDDVSKDSVHVRMKTSAQFFSTNVSNYTYEGTEMVRDIPSDRFVARRSDFPPRTPVPSVFEWRFATGQYFRIQQGLDMYSRGVPLQMKMSLPMYNISTIYNIYNYVQAKPDLLTWDISPCYMKRNRRRFQFSLPGYYKKQISGEQELFKYSVFLSLSSCTHASPLRITKLKLDFEKDIIVSFTLLDVAPLHGDITKTVNDTSLNKAADLLKTAFDNSKFTMTLDSSSKVAPIHKSLQEITEGPDAANQKTSLTVTTTTATQSQTQQPISTKPHQKKSRGTTQVTTAPQKNLHGSTLANVQCNTNGGGYPTGVVVAVCIVMIIAGGAGGTGLTIYLKRHRGVRWYQLRQ